MAGRKVFTSGEILTAADVNSFLMNQVVAVFADSTARSSAIPTPSEGMVTYVEDANRVEVYDGASFGPIGKFLSENNITQTGSFTTTSTSFVDVTDMSVTLTPQSTASVFYLAFHTSQAGNSVANLETKVRVVRDSTPLSQIGGYQAFANNASSGLAFVDFDSPNTASSITYKVQLQTTGSSTATISNRIMTIMEVVG